MEKRWFIKYIGNHWVGCSHTTPLWIYFKVLIIAFSKGNFGAAVKFQLVARAGTRGRIAWDRKTGTESEFDYRV